MMTSHRRVGFGEREKERKLRIERDVRRESLIATLGFEPAIGYQASALWSYLRDTNAGHYCLLVHMQLHTIEQDILS